LNLKLSYLKILEKLWRNGVTLVQFGASTFTVPLVAFIVFLNFCATLGSTEKEERKMRIPVVEDEPGIACFVRQGWDAGVGGGAAGRLKAAGRLLVALALL
jgi:hypothetical protein